MNNRFLEKIRRVEVISPTDFLKRVLKHFDKTDLSVVITVFITGIISNFYFFITDGLQADALSYAHFKVAGLWETQLGRPLIQVVDRLRFGFVNQFLIVLICLSLIAGAMLLIRRTFCIRNRLLLMLLSIVVCVAPQFVETYEFLYCADSYLLAFFCSALAVYTMSKIKSNVKLSKRVVLYGCIVFLTMVICGLYQAYLGCIAGLTIFLAIKEVLSEERISTGVRHFLRNVLCVALGMCLYYACLCLYCKILNTNLASYKGASSFGLGTFLQLPESVIHCYIDFFKFFFADSMIYNKYYHRDRIYAVLFLTFGVGLLIRLWKDKDETKMVKLARTGVILVLLAIAPIGVNVMNIIAPTTRINLVTGPGIISTVALIAVVFGDWFGNRDDRRVQGIVNIMRWVNCCALIALAWTLIISNTFTYIYRQRQYDNLETIMQDVYGRVVSLEEYDAKTPWMFSNIIQVQVNDLNRTNGMVARNMIVWQNFNGTRQYASFIYKYKGVRINTVDSDVYRKIVNTDQFKEMPVYPRDGSIDIIDGVIVIKVSEKTF